MTEHIQTPEQYETFAIGEDEHGNPIMYTCDPMALRDQGNPSAPSHSKMVFFERTVLEKYFANPDKYHFEGFYIKSSEFWLSISQMSLSHVSVFLGDLGENLPYKEQRHWQALNIIPQAAQHEPDLCSSKNYAYIEKYFYANYNNLNQIWHLRFGWPLFKKDFHDDDTYLEQSIRVPTNDSTKQFDEQIMHLARFIIDNLNKNKLDITIGKIKDEKSISTLERFLNKHKIKSPICKIFREIQNFRSSGSAHLKGENYDKLKEKHMPSANRQTYYAELLKRLVDEFTMLAGELWHTRKLVVDTDEITGGCG